MRFEPPVSLANAFPRAVAEFRRRPRVFRPVDLDNLSVEDRQDLAEFLSGSTDHSSQTYRTAMRNIQRWEKGRRPSPDQLRKIEEYMARRRRTPIIVNFEGPVLVSTDGRWRRIYNVGLYEAHLAFPALFEIEFLAAYGLPGASIIDVGLLEIHRT